MNAESQVHFNTLPADGAIVVVVVVVVVAA